MPKPQLIEQPKRVTLYLSKETLDRAKAIGRIHSTSLSRVVSDLINASSDKIKVVRVNADLSISEYEHIETLASKEGLTVPDFVTTTLRKHLP